MCSRGPANRCQCIPVVLQAELHAAGRLDEPLAALADLLGQGQTLEQLMHLMKGMLHPDPLMRFTVTQALQHPFLALHMG